MPNKLQYVVYSACAVAALAACGKKADPTPQPSLALDLTAGPLSFADDIEPILNVNCSGCHSAGSKIPPLFVGDEAALRQFGPAVLESVKSTTKRRMPFHHQPLSAEQEGKLNTFLAYPVGAVAVERVLTPFDKDVLPILLKNCGACHTPGSNLLPNFIKDEVTFRNFGAAVLASMVHPDPKGLMPPPRSRPAVSAAEQKILQDFLAK